MELFIHYLMSYDFLIENTSTGESKDSCLHVYQACHLKFVRIYSQVRKNKGGFSVVLMHVLNLCRCCST